MKINTLCLAVVWALSLAACKQQSLGDSRCAGYLGCSAGKEILAPASDGGSGSAGTSGGSQQINLGCGKPLPANQPISVAGTPKGYLQYTVMGTGETLLGNQPDTVGKRTFWVRVPADYDPNTKYRTVYIGQGCGAANDSENSTYQLYREASGGDEEAIYVAIDTPVDMVNVNCYDNRNGPESQEWLAFQLFHDVVDSTYCVDNNRVYVSGYSTGGWLGNMWGCYFAGDGEHPYNGSVPTSRAGAVPKADAGAAGAGGGGDAGESPDASSADAAAGASGASGVGVVDAAAGATGAAGSGTDNSDGDVNDTPPYVAGPGARKFAPQYHIKVQAVTSGGEPANNPPCNGPVAAIWIHDLSDTSNPISGNQAALARVLKMNGCVGSSMSNSPTATWDPEPTSNDPNVMEIPQVCLRYTSCPAQYPVVFCTTRGIGHLDQHELAIPAFTDFFKLVESAPTTSP
jgi:poly(3-hydroxybutyrate) depolymerase